jgi:cell division protease FtsH
VVGGHDEREQTLNALLVEMDGFGSNSGVIVLAATNRPETLDPALLRPGRFDRHVLVDRPDVRGREAILRVHVAEVKINPSVNLEQVARITSGFCGADLANLVNEAALLAARRNKRMVTQREFEEAKDKVMMGAERRSMVIDDEEKRKTAYHEAGHAIVSILTPDQDPVHKVTIVSRGRALGATLSLPEKDDYNHWRKKLLGRIAVCFGGRVAEDMVFGDVSAGAQNDIEQATNLARVMVCELGMSTKVGPIKYTADDENPFLGREFRIGGGVSERTLEVLDEEIKRVIDEQYAAATKLLLDNRRHLDAVAAALLKHETLSGDEVGAVMRGDDLEEFRQAQLRAQQAPPVKRAEPIVRPVDAVAAVEKKPDIGLSGA